MKKTPVEHVNPLIGTNSEREFSHGNVYPEISLPFGMACWTPQTGNINDGWIYQYNKAFINGFKLSHQPSPWIGDYGDFAIMPFISDSENFVCDIVNRAAKYKHEDEESHPYHHIVKLENNISVEITPTERCGFFRITFPKLNNNQKSTLIFDNWNCGEISQKSSVFLKGLATHNTGGVPENFACYFIIQTNLNLELLKSEKGISVFSIDTSETNILEVKIGTSFISLEQAELNLFSEIGNNSFQSIVDIAFAAWNKVLNKIEIENASEEQLKTFYSCFYRAQLYPRMFYEYDVNGNIRHYSPYNGKIENGKLFTDNGPWDTYRNIYPLYTIITPKLCGEMMNSWVNSYKEGGWYPKWASPGYRNCMIGTPIVNILTDSLYKGINNFDIESGYRGAIRDAEDESGGKGYGKAGLKFYKELGYVPMLDIIESCSRTLEFSYNDFNMAMFAKFLGKTEDYKKYLKRSLNYKNVFDHKDKFMKGRYSDGSWEKNFSPIKWGGWAEPNGGPYTEGNSWHYTFAVPFDPMGLIELIGGEDKFIEKIDQLLDSENNEFDNEYYGMNVHEMLEMVACNMGQYQHSNQPVHHLLYLYNYAGTPWKAAPHIRKVLNSLYKSDENGFCGDEDNGEMSAWYILSSFGFYPVCPGSSVPRYEIGTPLFSKVILKLEGNKTLEIIAENNSEKNIYVQSIEVNNIKLNRSWLKHEEIIKGGIIKFVMGDTPNFEFGKRIEDRPPSFI